MDLKGSILKMRDIKPNSLKAYMIILRKLNDNKDIENLDFLKNKKRILHFISDLAITTQRNYLAAILVALPVLKEETKLLEFYKEQLEVLNVEYNSFIGSHEKSELQKLNWMTLKNLRKIYESYRKEIRKEKYNKKETLTSKESKFLNNYLVVSLYVLMPPVRLDFAPMSIIKSIKDDDDKGNFLVNKSRNKKTFIINEYKSSKTYGKQVIQIPKELNTVLNLYLKFHKNDSFLLNTRGKPLTSNALSKLITHAFGRYTNNIITLNLLRHIYITEKVKIKTADEEKEEEKIAKSMQHSTATQKTYIKH